MTFRRSDSGQAAKHLFVREPMVWVEGPTDIPFYLPVLPSCRIEAAGGKPECRKLADTLIKDDSPYVVVLDGDYDILHRKKSTHRRVVTLQRHSSENYLFEKDAVGRVCCSYARVDALTPLLEAIFDDAVEHLDNVLRELVILDVAYAHSNCESTPEVFPDAADSMLLGKPGIEINPDRVSAHCEIACEGIDNASIERARKLVERFLARRRLVDLIRGRFVFGVLRRLVIEVVQSQRGKKPYIDNDGLRSLLSEAVWSTIPSDDHRTLRNRLTSAVREVERLHSAHA